MVGADGLEVYDFGLRLKEIREKKKLSQAEESRRLGIAKGTISRYERNVQNASIDSLIKLAVLYTSSVDYILGIANRTQIYIYDMPEKDQRIILRLIETYKEEIKE